jgi:hypothetical protein
MKATAQKLLKQELGVPVPKFLQVEKERKLAQRDRKHDKHQEAYEEFCKWSALPQELRDPKTQKDFEQLWKLPPRYTTRWKETEDFQSKRLQHFWRWAYDQLPDIAWSIVKRAKLRSPKDAQIFIDLLGKKMDAEKPPSRITPFVLVGVPQDKIEDLFVPKEYEPVIDATVKSQSK